MSKSETELTFLNEYTNIDKQKWNKFVEEHPKGNIFHSPDYYRVCRKSVTREPLVVAATEGGNILGIIQGVVQKENIKLFQSLTSRTVVWGGPIIHNGNEDIHKKLLLKFNEIASARSIYCQIRNLWCYSDKELELFNESGFTYIDHYGITIDLEPDLDQLWSNMQSQGRRNIRKAQKENLDFGFVDTAEDYWEGVHIVKSLYDYLGLPLPDDDYFKALFEELIPNGKLKVFGAYLDTQLIGVLFGLCFNGMIYEWYTGSKSSFLSKRPNDFLIGKVLEFGKENNYEVFDMGGGGKPGEEYGVRDHKLKFGSKLHHHGRFLNVYKPLLYKFGKFGVNYWDKIKKYIEN